MAHRYGMLPSQILEQATTHDIQIYLHAVKYIDRKQGGDKDLNESYSQEEIQEIYKSWRGSS